MHQAQSTPSLRQHLTHHCFLVQAHQDFWRSPANKQTQWRVCSRRRSMNFLFLTVQGYEKKNMVPFCNWLKTNQSLVRPWNSSFQCLNDLRTIASPFISTNYRKISSGIWTRLSPKNQRRPFPIFFSKARGWTRSNVHKTLKPWLFDQLISVFCSCCLAASSNLVSPLREEVPLRVPSPTGRGSSKGFLPHGKAFYRDFPPSLEGVPLWGPSCGCRSS